MRSVVFEKRVHRAVGVGHLAVLGIACGALLLSPRSLPADTPDVPAGAADSPSEPAAGSPLGRTLGEIAAADFRGRPWQLDDFASSPLLVVAFLGTECPLARLYTERLVQLEQEYSEQGVAFVAVMSNRQDSLAKITAFARQHALEFPVLKDAGNRLADRLGAERTPEVFVLDADRVVRYWGRIDDQYGIGYAREQPERQELRAALDDLLAGSPVAVPQTRSVGCIIGRQRPADESAQVTYGSHIAAILQRRCVECHRDGEIAPFALTDPDDVTGWAEMIGEVVREGRMPPWHAHGDYGNFANDRSMTAEEIDLIAQWVEAGAPQGDLTGLPQPPTSTEGWQLPRSPDLVIPVSPEPYAVPATGAVKYQYFVVDPEIDEDRWIEAAELLPGNRAVVHHILAFTRPRGEDGGIRAARGFLVGYVPGARVEPFPEGMAKRIPAGSELVFQVHYTPIGSPQEDQSLLGIVFADPDSVTHEVKTSSAVQTRLRIPPQTSHHEVKAMTPERLPESLLLSMSPHMHLRGKAFRYELVRPDGEREILLDIPAYDFNWQTTYTLAQPRPLEAGSRIACTAVYDNSPRNLNNPDPTATVRWGDQTWDEMMIGYFHYAVPKP